MGYAIAQLVQALRYKLQYGPGVDPESNRNDHQ